MTQSNERTPGGSAIYRHQSSDRPFQAAYGDGDVIDAVGSHIAQHIGEVAWVYHELASDLVHIDIYVVNPTTERPFYTLITSGMSQQPMSVPAGSKDRRYAELTLCLPPEWALGQEELKAEENYWPIRWLKILARLPHEYQTWLAPSHTVPNGDPAEPFAASTKFCCMLVSWPLLSGEAFSRLEIRPNEFINFYSVLPVYQKEMDYKLQHGIDALYEKFDQIGINELIDLRRSNAIT